MQANVWPLADVGTVVFAIPPSPLVHTAGPSMTFSTPRSFEGTLGFFDSNPLPATDGWAEQ